MTTPETRTGCRETSDGTSAALLLLAALSLLSYSRDAFALQIC